MVRVTLRQCVDHVRKFRARGLRRVNSSAARGLNSWGESGAAGGHAFVEELDVAALLFAGAESGRDGPPGSAPGDTAERVHLRPLEPHIVQPAAGARDPAQRRVDVADRPARMTLRNGHLVDRCASQSLHR